MSPSPDDLDKELAELEEALQGKAVRTGIVAAIKPVKAEMKSFFPRRTGSLAASIGHLALSKSATTRIGAGGYQTTILVGPTRRVPGRGSMGWLANILDQGAKPHIIRPKARRRKSNSSAAVSFGGRAYRSVNHPGVRATNWMEKSFDRHSSGFESRFYQGLRKFIDKQTQ